MNKVLIVHGFEGSPNGGWRPWLMGELEKLDVYACALPMPSPNNPVLEEWVEEIARQMRVSRRDKVFLVGHSLGVPAILRYLENASDKNIHGAVLVSGPIYKTKKRKVAKFLAAPFDFKKIKSRCKNFAVIHGDNDRNVSYEQGVFLAKELGAKLYTIKNGGHLNGSSGWLKLPETLSCLRSLTKK